MTAEKKSFDGKERREHPTCQYHEGVLKMKTFGMFLIVFLAVSGLGLEYTRRVDDEVHAVQKKVNEQFVTQGDLEKTEENIKETIDLKMKNMLQEIKHTIEENHR